MAVCKICNIEKPDNYFYSYYHSTQQKVRTRRMCKNCYDIGKKNRNRVKLGLDPLPIQYIQPEEIIQPDEPELICGTFEEYKARVSEYYNDESLKSVYDLLVAMGWIYDTNKFIWYKPGWYKNIDGSWNLPETNYLYEKIRRKTKVTSAQIENFKELRKRGWSYARIANKYDIDDNTVIRWLKMEI